MELSKTQKILLGIFTFLPFFIFPFIFWQLFDAILNIIKISEHGEPEPREILIEVFKRFFNAAAVMADLYLVKRRIAKEAAVAIDAHARIRWCDPGIRTSCQPHGW